MDAKQLFIDIEVLAREAMRRYNVSPHTGFLAEKPLARFPENFRFEVNKYLAHIDALGYSLEKNVAEKSVTREVARLSLPPQGLLEALDRRGMYRLMLVVSEYAHAYFHETLKYKNVGELLADDSKKVLLAQLAIPLYLASKATGIAPSMSYCLYGLQNYYYTIPGSHPVTPESIHTLHSFTNAESENWFVIIHQAMEAKYAPAIFALYKAHLLAFREKAYGNEECVAQMIKWLHIASRIDQEVVDILERMPEHCNPKTYFESIRMFYSYPKNVVYEGVNELEGKPQNILGETGGQTPQMQFKNKILGIDLESDEYFPKMRLHMPKEHRDLIMLVEGSPVRKYVLAHKNVPALVRRYNVLLRCVMEWRSEHLGLVNSFIKPYGESHGTGKPPLGWLKILYEKSKECLIPNEESPV